MTNEIIGDRKDGDILISNKPDWTITNALFDCIHGYGDRAPWAKYLGSFTISWCSKSAGFGQISFTVKLDGSLIIQTSVNDKKFIKEAINYLIDHAEIIDYTTVLFKVSDLKCGDKFEYNKIIYIRCPAFYDVKDSLCCLNLSNEFFEHIDKNLLVEKTH